MIKNILVYLLLILSSAAHAELNLGSNIIVNGSTITVLAPGPDLQGIVDDITDADADKPYLIKLHAGEYEITQVLKLKQYVSLMGSGRDATIITGEISFSSTTEDAAVISGASNSTISDMSIINQGTGASSAVGVYNIDADARLERLNILASNGTTAMALINTDSDVVVTDVRMEASDASDCRATWSINDSNLKYIRVTLLAETNCTGTAKAAHFRSSSAEISHSLLAVKDATNSIALDLQGATAELRHTSITSQGLASSTVSYAAQLLDYITDISFGFFSNVSMSATGLAPRLITASGSSSAKVYSSNLDASGTGTAINFGTGANNTAFRIVNTQINGTFLNDPSGTQCYNTYSLSLGTVTC